MGGGLDDLAIGPELEPLRCRAAGALVMQQQAVDAAKHVQQVEVQLRQAAQPEGARPWHALSDSGAAWPRV